ncbi:MAG: YjbF family lipoprotein, partial [Acinetobacter sp.]
LDSYQQLKFLFSENEEITVTPETINKLPYASAFVTIDDRPKIFVVLAFVDDDRLSWVSSNRGMVITEHGRITKTLKLENDLHDFSAVVKDPLTQPLTISGAQFSYNAEWAKDRRSGRHIQSIFKQLPDEHLEINGSIILTSHYEEFVQSIEDEQVWTNYYWLDKTSGVLRKTVQKLGPDNNTIEMVFTKPYSP